MRQIPLVPGAWRVSTAGEGGAAILHYRPMADEPFPRPVVVPVLETLLSVTSAPGVTLHWSLDAAAGALHAALEAPCQGYLAFGFSAVRVGSFAAVNTARMAWAAASLKI